MIQWLSDATFYEVYPQSFQDTNSDGIGDLNGITRRLDYIRELGFNAVWINPCFMSPFHDAGYDISDYDQIAPRYGTNEDMRELFTRAHQLGMHVILDLVPGHTSIDHPWFRASMQSEQGEYAGRYIWADVWEDFKGISNLYGGINGFCERGSCAVNFFSTQPALNYGFANPEKPWQLSVDSPEAAATRHAIEDVMRFWLSMGCDGFRVDMAGSLVKGDPDQKATIKLWQGMRSFLDKEFPNAAIISEWGNPERALLGGFHMDFLLHFGESHYMDLFRENAYFSRAGNGDISAFIQNYQNILGKTANQGLICIPSGNHDMPRISDTLDADEMKLAYAFLFTMPGVPFLYYGDEIGMRYQKELPSKEGGYDRTGSRTPMQWDGNRNAGFSDARENELYLPVDAAPGSPNAADQKADAHSLWHTVQTLLRLRQDHEPLQSTGEFHVEYVKKGSEPIVYRRTGKTGSVLVAINPASSMKCININTKAARSILYSDHGLAALENGTLTIPPCSAAIFEL